MTLRHLTIFRKVYEQLSITKAGEELHMAQPAISLAIKELEEYYNLKLFDRMNRRIYPTQEAEKLFEYVVHILDLYDVMEEETKEWKETSEIRIGSSITIGNYALPSIIQMYKKIHPTINIKVQVCNFEELEKLLIENKIDLALIETDAISSVLSSIAFMSDRLVTIAGKNHPLLHQENVQLSQLLSYPFFTREKGSSVYKLVNSLFSAYGLPIAFDLESSSTQAISKHVEFGFGIATLPYMMVKQEIEDKKVYEVDVPDLELERNYHIVYHKHKFISKPMEAFIHSSLAFGREMSLSNLENKSN